MLATSTLRIDDNGNGKIQQFPLVCVTEHEDNHGQAIMHLQNYGPKKQTRSNPSLQFPSSVLRTSTNIVRRITLPAANEASSATNVSSIVMHLHRPLNASFAPNLNP